MANDRTEMERRVAYLETLVMEMGAKLRSVEALAGQAKQQAGDGSDSFGGGGISADLCYINSAAARSTNVTGACTIQLVNGIGIPPVLTATGDPGDSGIPAFNVTAGTGSNAFGICLTIGGKRYVIVLDCLSGTSPGTPATPSTSGSVATGSGLTVPGGVGVLAVSPLVIGSGRSTAGGFGVIAPGFGAVSGTGDIGEGA